MVALTLKQCACLCLPSNGVTSLFHHPRHLMAPSIIRSGYTGGDIDVHVCVHTGFIYKETRVVMYTYIPSFSRN